MEVVSPGAPIKDNITLYHRGWIAQHIGWALLFIFLSLSVIGLFGSGVMSRKTLTEENTMIVYEKYGRHETPMAIRITGEVNNGIFQFSIPQQYFTHFQLEKVVPEPREEKIDNGHVVYTYSAGDPATIMLYFSPNKTGSYINTFKINGRSFKIDQFIYL